mmetsp:Transcript_33010/g.107919  ORF Transcript_33010/g.107919 Transcript_33010/m.107919 type:complete len:258 (-) Transcript_33010:790-1563(-)
MTFEIESHGLIDSWIMVAVSPGSSSSSSSSTTLSTFETAICERSIWASSSRCASSSANASRAAARCSACMVVLPSSSSSASWMRRIRIRLLRERETGAPFGSARGAFFGGGGGSVPSFLCTRSASSCSSASRMSMGSAPPCSSWRTAPSIRSRRRDPRGARESSRSFIREARREATSDASPSRSSVLLTELPPRDPDALDPPPLRWLCVLPVRDPPAAGTMAVPPSSCRPREAPLPAESRLDGLCFASYCFECWRLS